MSVPGPGPLPRAARTRRGDHGGVARLTPDDVACWLLKSAGTPAELPGPGEGPRRLRRCLRRSYRLDLVAPGQPCLLWVSGRDAPGVRALGTVAGPPGADDAVDVDLVTLRDPVPRTDLLLDDRFRTAEVVRMAAGSNPSYLTPRQLEAVLDLLARDERSRWERTVQTSANATSSSSSHGPPR